MRTTLSRRHSASNTISGREILASLGGAPFCAASGMTFANGDARQVSVVAVEKPSPKWAEAKTPSGTFRNRNVGTAKSRMVSHFDAHPESAAYNAKNESAPDSFESGDALVEQSSPENCSQPLDVLLRIGAVVIRFVTQSSLISTQIAPTPSSLRPHRQAPRLRTWNHQTTFCHGARFLSCIWPAGSFVSSLHRKRSHRAEGP